jgi:hypothetical protein
MLCCLVGWSCLLAPVPVFPVFRSVADCKKRFPFRGRFFWRFGRFDRFKVVFLAFFLGGCFFRSKINFFGGPFFFFWPVLWSGANPFCRSVQVGAKRVRELIALISMYRGRSMLYNVYSSVVVTSSPAGSPPAHKNHREPLLYRCGVFRCGGHHRSNRRIIIRAIRREKSIARWFFYEAAALRRRRSFVIFDGSIHLFFFFFFSIFESVL